MNNNNKKMIVKMSKKELEYRLGMSGAISDIKVDQNREDTVYIYTHGDGYDISTGEQIPWVEPPNKHCLINLEAMRKRNQ